MNNIKEIKARLGDKLNNYLYKDIKDGVVPLSSIPNGKKLLILNACYKKEATSQSLCLISEQPAKPLQGLRELGYIMYRPYPEKDLYVYKNKNGQRCRKIIGYNVENNIDNKFSISLSKKEKENFLKYEKDFLTGNSHNLEIDHRMPVAALKKINQPYPNIKQLIKESKNAKEYYQALSRTTNQIKRESCTKCLLGEKIERPPIIEQVEKMGVKYKNYFNENYEYNIKNNKPACYGCFWFDYKKPISK